MSDLLRDAAERAIRYQQTIHDRPVFPTDDAVAALSQFDEPLPETPTDPREVVRLLDEVGAPATVATTGGRYYGFVTGGALPATVAAQWLVSAWDENAGITTLSPVGAYLDHIALKWLLDALGFPLDFAGGFVTGATVANFTALAAARHHLLKNAGWDVEARGLFDAPEIKVVVGDEVHVSVLQALMMVGFGRERVIRVPTDAQGRMRVDALPPLDALTLVCTQAGNVNTGAFDPVGEISEKAHAHGAWVHVDGAFGLWALAAPARKHLAAGVEQADSWATDGHKWLNVPYDSGVVLCRHHDAIAGAMTISAPYLFHNEERQPEYYTPEQSRRARGVEVWAALKSLGRQGLADMIEGCCQHATRFAEGFRAAGYTVHNDVVINQVLVSFGDAEATDRVINAIQREGTTWAGRTVWQGHVAMRLSVSSWATTADDVERALAAMLRVADAVTG